MTASTPRLVMVAACVVLAIAFGVRSVFGIVIGPLSTDLNWPRETFAFSLALQNLAWGLFQPIFGMIADRWGDQRALWLGFGCYVLGLVLSALSSSALGQHLGVGLLLGAGIAGTAFGLVLSVVGRATPEAKRSQALGLATALGSLGQVVFPPLASWAVVALGWREALWVFAGLTLLMAAFIPFLRAPSLPASAAPVQPTESMSTVLARAFGHNSYILLVLGFFVCGFHLAFITAHFPAFVNETCGTTTLGAATISIIGLANVVGTFAAGRLGAVFPKRYLLSAIYALRAVAISLFILLPITPASVVAFSLAIGALWLSTVPLTTGLIAVMFGPRYMATLYGFVFLSHQIGSFVGVWLGGRVYDATGNFDLIWYLGIALGVFSALVHLPIRERAWQAKPA